MKRVVHDLETGESRDVVENVSKVCADAWNKLADDSKERWNAIALQMQKAEAISDRGRKYLRDSSLKELRSVCQVCLYMYNYKEAEKLDIALFGIVHNLGKIQTPDLIYNSFCVMYADGFVKAELVDKFCSLAKHKTSNSITDRQIEYLLKLTKKKEPNGFNRFMKAEAKSML
jgi:hypothetical protein